MRKHGGTPSRRDKHVTLAAISPPGVARGCFVGGQQSRLAGCKPPPLFTRGASSCSSQGRRQGEPWGASPRPSAPTYLPGIGTTPHSRLFKFRFQFQVHLDQFFTREGRRQCAEHLLIGYQQFLQAGVKVRTLEFLKEILLSMEVALSMFFLFLPISSFGRHRTIVPLRGTLLPIVQRIH